MTKEELKKMQTYFEDSVKDMLKAMVKVQDAWFCVEDAADWAEPYAEGYPFDKDFGSVMCDVDEWLEKCMAENKMKIDKYDEFFTNWRELDIEGWWTQKGDE